MNYALLFEIVRALKGALTHLGLSIQTNAETYRINNSHHADKSTILPATLSYKHNMLR